MGSLWILATRKGRNAQPHVDHKGLLYVQIIINGKQSKAMLDTEASYNFISMEEAKRLGLKLTSKDETLKVVNSTAKLIAGIAKGVPTTLDA